MTGTKKFGKLRQCGKWEIGPNHQLRVFGKRNIIILISMHTKNTQKHSNCRTTKENANSNLKTIKHAAKISKC